MSEKEQLECRLQTLRDIAEIFDADIIPPIRQRLTDLTARVNTRLNEINETEGVNKRLNPEF